jgi:hypothetical protein
LSSIKVYPNPAKSYLNINLPNEIAGETSFDLIDIQGRKVLHKMSSNKIETLSIEHLSKGVYLLSIENDNIQKTIKVVKE